MARSFLEEMRLRRLERRGEIVRGTAGLWDFVEPLVHDLMPREEHEVSRDLFLLLAGNLWAKTRKTKVELDSHEILVRIREGAWLAYTNMPELIRGLRSEFPDSKNIAGQLRYFEEISDKGCRYLFLPIVSRIARHQASGPIPAVLMLDKIQAEYGTLSAAGVARTAFALAPSYTRERDAFLVAVIGATWGKGNRPTDKTLLAAIIGELRSLYVTPGAALGSLRREDRSNFLAARLVAMADEVSRLDPSLWLETLFLAESWLAGPQVFEHPVEIHAG